MVHIVSDTSTLYSTRHAREAGFAVSPLSMPDAVYEILPLSPAFITQGGPGCVAVQYIEA